MMADIENFPVTGLRGGAEYMILYKEEGNLYQGKVQRFGEDHGDVSFLLFESEEKMHSIVKNLDKFTENEFLTVKDVIQDTANGCYWVVVEHVTSLTTIQKNEAVCSGKRLNQPYRQILRDVIIGFHKLHGKNTQHGPISASDVYVGPGGRGKLAHICGNANDWTKEMLKNDVAELRDFFRQILAFIPNVKNKELSHFLSRAFGEKLFYHPLLMSDVERFYMPLITSTNMRHDITYPNSAAYAQSFDFFRRKYRNLDWEPSVPRHGAYRLVYRNGNYRRGPWSRFCYTRNCTQHITDDNITRELKSQRLPSMRGSRGAIAICKRLVFLF